MARIGKKWQWPAKPWGDVKEFLNSSNDAAAALVKEIQCHMDRLKSYGRDPEVFRRKGYRAIRAYQGGDTAAILYYIKQANSRLVLHFEVVRVPKQSGSSGILPKPSADGWNYAMTRAAEHEAGGPIEEEGPQVDD